MNNSSGSKDNANPVILNVDRTAGRKNKRRAAAGGRPVHHHPLGWSDILAMSADRDPYDDGDDPSDEEDYYYDYGVDDGGGDGPVRSMEEGDLEFPGSDAPSSSSVSMRYPEDRAVVLALADVSSSTKGRGVALLNRAHVSVADTATAAPRQKSVLSSSIPSVSVLRHSESTSGRSDAGKKEPQQSSQEDGGAAKDGENDSKKISVAQARDRMTKDEIFEIIRNIQDPEHPLTLEQLGVVSRDQIDVVDLLDYDIDESAVNHNGTSEEEEMDEITARTTDGDDAIVSSESKKQRRRPMFSTIDVRFTPTVPHCSMSTLIGLSLRVKLLRSVPPRFKIRVSIEPGTHQSEATVNKQLSDKERVCAALENPHLCQVVNRCIGNGMNATLTPSSQ